MMPTCTPNPCLNGGICSLLAAGTIVSCTCPTGYTGNICQTSELTVGMHENIPYIAELSQSKAFANCCQNGVSEIFASKNFAKKTLQGGH